MVSRPVCGGLGRSFLTPLFAHPCADHCPSCSMFYEPSLVNSTPRRHHISWRPVSELNPLLPALSRTRSPTPLSLHLPAYPPPHHPRSTLHSVLLNCGQSHLSQLMQSCNSHLNGFRPKAQVTRIKEKKATWTSSK